MSRIDSVGGGKAVRRHHHGIPERGAALRADGEAGRRAPVPPAAGEDCHAGESEAFFSVYHIAEFYYHDLSGDRSQAGGIHL